MISAHLTSPPPLPGGVRPDLAATDPVFARALAKDPAQRFERGSDFAAALAGQLRQVAAGAARRSLDGTAPADACLRTALPVQPAARRRRTRGRRWGGAAQRGPPPGSRR